MKIPRMTEEEYQFLKPTPVSVMVWMTPMNTIGCRMQPAH